MLHILEITTGALMALNLLDFFRGATSAWRYIFSGAYRARVHVRWKDATQSQVIGDVIGSTFCALITLFLVGLGICAILRIGWFAVPAA